jgi:hypothetical protein
MSHCVAQLCLSHAIPLVQLCVTPMGCFGSGMLYYVAKPYIHGMSFHWIGLTHLLFSMTDFGGRSLQPATDSKPDCGTCVLPAPICGAAGQAVRNAYPDMYCVNKHQQGELQADSKPSGLKHSTSHKHTHTRTLTLAAKCMYNLLQTRLKAEWTCTAGHALKQKTALCHIDISSVICLSQCAPHP